MLLPQVDDAALLLLGLYYVAAKALMLFTMKFTCSLHAVYM